MVGPLVAPLVGAAGSLAGGLLGQSSERRAAKQAREWALEDQAQQFVRHRAASELAGFNPLATLGFSGAGMVGQTSAGGGNYMGTAIADAAMIAADAVAKRSDAGKLSDVQAQNRALSRKVQSLTLRPKIGGIYAQRGVTPNLKQALGVHDGSVDTQRSGVSVRDANPRSNGIDSVAPDETNTYKTYLNDGQSSDVPLGPDIDEVISGAVIAANNRDKARRAFRASPNMTWGTPLSIPFGIGVSRVREIMPPSPRYPDKLKSPSARSKPSRKRGDYPFMAISP